MASADDLLTRLNAQVAEMVHKAVAEATAPIRNAGDYRILAISTMRYDEYVAVKHQPCQKLVFGSSGDSRELDVATLLSLIAAHRCENGGWIMHCPDCKQPMEAQTFNGADDATVHLLGICWDCRRQHATDVAKKQVEP